MWGSKYRGGETMYFNGECKFNHGLKTLNRRDWEWTQKHKPLYTVYKRDTWSIKKIGL